MQSGSYFACAKENELGATKFFCSGVTSKRTQSFIQEYYENRTIPLLVKLIDQGKNEGDVNPLIGKETTLLYV